MRSMPSVLIAVLAAPMLSGCTTIGPTVPVMPGAGRSEAVFAEDHRDCMQQTDVALRPVAFRLNLQAVTVPQMQATNDYLQRDYNHAYGGCMAARGNLVGAPASLASNGPMPPAGGVGFQAPSNSPRGPSLTDATSGAAMFWLRSVLRGFREDCPAETIAVDAYDAPITPVRGSRIVAFTEPHGGSCFGQPGENDYLLTQRGQGWVRLLAAEPGSIDVLETRHGGYRDVELRSLGQCAFVYRWDGRAYVKSGTRDCPLDAPPGVGDVAGRIRGR